MVQKYIKTIHLIYLRGFWAPYLNIYSHFLENKLKKLKFVTFAVSSQKWPNWIEKPSETIFLTKIQMYFGLRVEIFWKSSFLWLLGQNWLKIDRFPSKSNQGGTFKLKWQFRLKNHFITLKTLYINTKKHVLFFKVPAKMPKTCF